MGDSDVWVKPTWWDNYHIQSKNKDDPTPMQDIASAPFLAATFGLMHPLFIIPTDIEHPVSEQLLGLDFLIRSLPVYQLPSSPEASATSTDGTPPLSWVPVDMHRFAKFPNVDGSDPSPSPESQSSPEDNSPSPLSPVAALDDPALSPVLPNNLIENFQNLACISMDAYKGIPSRAATCQKAPPKIVLDNNSNTLENVPEFSPQHTTSSPKSLVLPPWFSARARARAAASRSTSAHRQ